MGGILRIVVNPGEMGRDSGIQGLFFVAQFLFLGRGSFKIWLGHSSG